MSAHISSAEVLQLRMRAQLLAPADSGPDPMSLTGLQRVTEVARHMLALQGQDWPASRWALGARAPGTSASDVYAAFNAGALVRSWPMRGTVHVMAAEDIAWVQDLTGDRLKRGAVKRRDFLGLPESTLERVVAVSHAALAGGARLTRQELAQTWTDAGISWQSNWRYHLVWWLCQNGIATMGPLQRESGESVQEPLIVLAADWIVHPRQLTGDEALAELVTRYTHARGPVTLGDFAWWTGLTARQTQRAFSLAHEAGRLTPVSAEDTGPCWITPEALGEPLAPRPADKRSPAQWQFLTAFDEHLLGYSDRRPQLQPEQISEIVPGRNGVFRATIVKDGVIKGTWKRTQPRGSHVQAVPCTSGTLPQHQLQAPLQRWARFHGLEQGTLEVV